jgi:hypothetical protein
MTPHPDRPVRREPGGRPSAKIPTIVVAVVVALLILYVVVATGWLF